MYFKKEIVLDRTDLPTEVKQWVDQAYCDYISGNNSYIRVEPMEVMHYEEFGDGWGWHRTRRMTLEEFTENGDSEANFRFLNWCLDQGQVEEFTLKYWW